VLVVRALNLAGIPNIQLAQLTVIVGMSALGVALFPSRRIRAWLKVKLVKHFFQHRYDYRVEWLRFTETLGRPDADAAPLDERIIKAIADIIESPGGVLLMPDEHGTLTPATRRSRTIAPGMGGSSNWTASARAPARCPARKISSPSGCSIRRAPGRRCR